VAELAVGDQRVDLRAALEALGARPGISTVRVDSGGGLTGALLSEELVDEVSLLLHPWWTGSAERPWHGNAAGVPAVLELVSRESIDQLVWLRYRFRR
jgi:2,5-diamino-6-(ribosylamino)-4(3H)-pyrimidinone 5'-phosphate reductase